ncbi:MAG: hypothetical protein U1F27_17380 [Turneriella sp.]
MQIPIHFFILKNTPLSAFHSLLRLAMPLPVFILIACNAYNLDGKIRSVLQPGLAISTTVFTDIPLSNKGVTRNLSAYTTGGTAPYQYSMTITGTVQTYMTISLVNGALFVGRNTATAMPTTLASLPQMPTVELKVTDSTGDVQTVSGTLQVHLKRVLVTKDVITFDSTQWHTGGTNDYSSCSSGDAVQKANCRCSVVTKAQGIPGSAQYKAWLSSSAIDASCNLTGIVGKSCTPTQYDGGPWYNMAGNLVAEDMGPGTAKGLLAVNVATNQPLQSAIQYFEDGTTAGSITVWGGTDPTGLAGGAAGNCTNWTITGGTAQYGRVDGINTANTSPFWNGGSQSCAGAMGFYCFEAD